jgi:hypothetical protein
LPCPRGRQFRLKVKATPQHLGGVFGCSKVKQAMISTREFARIIAQMKIFSTLFKFLDFNVKWQIVKRPNLKVPSAVYWCG